MNSIIKQHFSEKLANLLFLEVKAEKLQSIFKTEGVTDVLLPIRSRTIIDNVKKSNNINEIPISNFVEGMFYVLGADNKFKYCEVYCKLLSNLYGSKEYIKGLIYDEVKKENYEDAYLFLNGLVKLENNIENYEKLLLICEKLKVNNNLYEEEELRIIEDAKSIDNYPKPYLLEALIMKNRGEYDKAILSLNNYLHNGGAQNDEIRELIQWLKINSQYKNGKAMIDSDPEGALRLLIPLIDELYDDTSLLYSVAICYRKIENYEKAIYYLNEAFTLDSDLVEVVNELGINYAFLGQYEIAIQYFRKVFEATRSVDVCTNLIMCYFNLGDLIQAKLHLDIAEKLNPEDEIVIKLKKMIK